MRRQTFKTVTELEGFMCDERNSGKAVHVMVLHDDGCSAGYCKCEPWFEVEDLTVENALAGQERQAEWIRQTAS